MSSQDKACRVVVFSDSPPISVTVFRWRLIYGEQQIESTKTYAYFSEATEAARHAAKLRGMTIIEEEPE